jgi:hypothetical protein
VLQEHSLPTGRRHQYAHSLFFAASVVLATAFPAFGIVTSNPNPGDPTDGLNLGTRLGADRFYANGFTGSAATIANVEAGYVWNGHETLGHVQTFVPGMGALAEFDRHATWVGMLIGGRPTVSGNAYQQGIAYGANLWSGAIATTWIGSPYTTSFDYSVSSLADAYKAILITGVNGKTADVTNSSWSDGSDPEAARYEDYSRAVDAIAGLSHKTMVFSAGNRSSAGSVGTPGAGFNVITVASLGNDTASPTYDTVSSFSSRGPQPIFIPTVRNADYFAVGNGVTIPNARAAVDIAAPGENIVTAFYGGATGGNRNGTDTGVGSTSYSSGIAGTSFATPIVAAGATLMADAAHQRLGDATKALDGRVMKANLLNGADKIPGWNNGQTLQGGVIRTTQALDYASGAGRMNLSKSYDQLLSGTTDVAGTGGGTISGIGWDYGVVAENTPNDYSFAAPLLGGSTLTVTLDWFIDREINLATDATLETSFDNLTLQVRAIDSGTLIAESATLYNEVEHLNFLVPTTATYSLHVLWAGEVWDLVNDANQTTYGLAWSATMVPEPGPGLGAFAIIALLRRRKGIRCSSASSATPMADRKPPAWRSRSCSTAAPNS